MSRILLFAPWARYSPHFETDLEIIENHLEQGDEVHFVGCDAELVACDRNPHHDLVRCNVCIGRREAGLALLSAPVRRVPLWVLAPEDHAELAALDVDFDDAEDLKRFAVEQFDIGYAVLSTMVSFLRDPDPMASANRPVMRGLLVSALAVYRSFQHQVERTRYDRVYVFNGRFAITRAVLRACASRGVECYTHERGHHHDHYALYRNTTIHDIEHFERAIREAWDAADPIERERLGTRFYEERAQGAEQGWFSFIEAQQRGLLPHGFDENRRNVVFFNSSQDEFEAIGETWRNPLYDDQEHAVARVARALRGRDDVHVYLRVHPNLAGLDNAQTRAIAALDEPNLTVIPAESPVCTYALLRAARTVVSFGSTVGIEAVYWGVPSILAGQCYYRGLGGVLLPASHDEVVALLERDLDPGPREPALMYGHFLSTFGTPYRHYAAEGVFEGRFHGRRVRPGAARAGLAALLRLARPLERVLRRRALARVRSGLIG